MTEPDRARELQRFFFPRERSQVLAVSLIVALVIPAWIPFDYLLEPLVWKRFLPLRLLVFLVCLGVQWTARRTRRLLMLRLQAALVMLTTGISIALMMPSVHDYYALYLLGFSLVFWGSGVFYVWPLGWQVPTLLLVLLSYPLAELLLRRTPEYTQLWGGLFYLTTALLVSSGNVLIQRRLQERLFLGSRRLARTNRELSLAMQKLKDAQARLVVSEKQSALGRLLANLSHELNNPMTVIQNNLDPIKGYFDDTLAQLEAARQPDSTPAQVAERWQAADQDFVSEDYGSAVQAVRTAVGRIRAVHADLRAFVRGDAPQRVQVDVREGLRATVAMLRRNVSAEVTVQEDYGSPPLIEASPGQLNQVFFNLLQNAIDAVGGRGVILVQTRYTPGDGYIEVVVQDSGPGVSAEARPHLFEPFFTTNPVGKGTGLGLAISYQIVLDHGGLLRLASPVPKAAAKDADKHAAKDVGSPGSTLTGACFVVKLPLVARRPSLPAIPLLPSEKPR